MKRVFKWPHWPATNHFLNVAASMLNLQGARISWLTTAMRAYAELARRLREACADSPCNLEFSTQAMVRESKACAVLARSLRGACARRVFDTLCYTRFRLEKSKTRVFGQPPYGLEGLGFIGFGV